MKHATLITTILVLCFMAAPALALASSVSVFPTSVDSGSESGVSVTYSNGDNAAIFYLFDPSGVSVQDWGGRSYYNNGSQSFLTLYPTSTNLATGTWTVFNLDTTGQYDAGCGTGITLAACEGSIGGPWSATDLTITSPPPPPPPAASTDNTYNLVWFFVAWCGSVGIIYIVIRLLQMLWNYL